MKTINPIILLSMNKTRFFFFACFSKIKRLFFFTQQGIHSPLANYSKKVVALILHKNEILPGRGLGCHYPLLTIFSSIIFFFFLKGIQNYLFDRHYQ